MVPIAPTVFWGPMAYAIMGGLAVATALTLVFLPALYVTWFGIKRPHSNAGKATDVTEIVDVAEIADAEKVAAVKEAVLADH
jgi:hypothetical protein